MKWQEFVKDYLTFTRKDRIGILIIAFIMLLVFFLPEIILQNSKKTEIQPDTTWFSAVKKLEIKKSDTSNENYQNNDENTNLFQFDKNKESYNENNLAKRELFYFDPNTISESGWKKLGLKDKTIKTIQNYLHKGGSFKRPEDLQKIYGLHEDEFERLSPFIKIELSASKNQDKIISATSETENENIKNYSPRYLMVDVNSADTTAFIMLPGIGSKLAARIVNFRDKLGGFYSIDQIAETFGLPDSTYQKIKQFLKLENTTLKKININTATVDELKVHPYIKYNLANPIVAYRKEHGPFEKVEDIKQIMIITDDVYKKINPYFSTK